jgi:hypothetical protein
MPFFNPAEDPGPDFAALAKLQGLVPVDPSAAVDERLQITHATTVVAIRYADGVVMAGDRRATSGNIISHRAIEMVFPADRHSGVAIAGAAGPAMEMVKLFQLQLEVGGRVVQGNAHVIVRELHPLDVHEVTAAACAPHALPFSACILIFLIAQRRHHAQHRRLRKILSLG